jgi:hypothetical protein
MKNKKGQIMSQLGALGIGIASLAIVLVVTFLIIAQARTNIVDIEGLENDSSDCLTSVACNATTTLRGAVEDIPGWVPLIVIAVIGSILLGLVRLFGIGRR